MKRRTLPALFLAVVLSLGLLTPAAAAGTFSDVPENAWYASDVQDVQQYGIIQGVGSNRFLPEGKLTYAQAITMAARTYAYLHNETIPNSNSSQWYDSYLNYALSNNFVSEYELPTSLDVPCDRDSMARMFYAILDEGSNTILNDVEEIPDVDNNTGGIPIYSLYRFGILTGSDEYGAFYPTRSITRAETSAILNRLLNPNKRKTFTLQEAPPIRYLDLTKAWTFTEEVEEYDPNDLDGIDNIIHTTYKTTIAFMPDGSLYGLYYTPDSGFILPMRGTYTMNGKILTLNVYGAEGTSPATSYEMQNNTPYSIPGFHLTLISEEGLYSNHQYGDHFVFMEDDTMNAQQCKAKCLQFWGVEPQ